MWKVSFWSFISVKTQRGVGLSLGFPSHQLLLGLVPRFVSCFTQKKKIQLDDKCVLLSLHFDIFFMACSPILEPAGSFRTFCEHCSYFFTQVDFGFLG